MRVLQLTGWDRLTESGSGTPGQATRLTGPAEYPAVLVVVKGECTVGDDRVPVAEGQGVMVEAGDTVNLRATTTELEILRVEFVDRP